jgi:thymidylate kinase
MCDMKAQVSSEVAITLLRNSLMLATTTRSLFLIEGFPRDSQSLVGIPRYYLSLSCFTFSYSSMFVCDTDWQRLIGATVDVKCAVVLDVNEEIMRQRCLARNRSVEDTFENVNRRCDPYTSCLYAVAHGSM